MKLFLLYPFILQAFLCCIAAADSELQSDDAERPFVWNIVLSNRIDNQPARIPIKDESETRKAIPLPVSQQITLQQPALVTSCNSSNLPPPQCNCSKPVNDVIYWRVWDGRIPEDAVQGGTTSNKYGTNIPIYLGQVFIHQHRDAKIQPVMIFSNSKSVTATYINVYERSEDVKILCSGDPASLKWIHKSQIEAEEINIRECVVAGYESHFRLYFGRAIHRGQKVIGKVVLKNNVVYFATDSEGEKSSRDYEVLCIRE